MYTHQYIFVEKCYGEVKFAWMTITSNRVHVRLYHDDDKERNYKTTTNNALSQFLRTNKTS